VDDRAHDREHSLEVQLPFLQITLDDVRVLPLAVGCVPTGQVVAVLDLVWGGPDTLVVVSTDLSHYHDHITAQSLDRKTAGAVVARAPEALGPADACGFYPLRGLLESARRRHMEVELLDLRTSADTAGDPSRVVGYGAFAIG
jgi:MEMO1 family protein